MTASLLRKVLMPIIPFLLAASSAFSDQTTQKFLEPKLLEIPAGCFEMGSPEEEAKRDSYEGPQHRVCLDGFEIGKYEVTFDEWDACVAAGGCAYDPPGEWGRGTQPVTSVSWEDVYAYIKWLNSQTGKNYRLLSEAEWEYAARAGTTTVFSTGECINTSQANYNGTLNDYKNCGARTGVQHHGTRNVGSYAANPYGLYDLFGNAWEWVNDCWNDDYRSAPNNGKSSTLGDCERRVLRGGEWSSFVSDLRSAKRNYYYMKPHAVYRSIGFRLARSLAIK